MTHLSRREFVTVLGGGLIVCPGTLLAEGADGARRVGVLMRIAEDDPGARANVQTFQRGLEKLGWITGRNVLIDYRWAAGSDERGQRAGRAQTQRSRSLRHTDVRGHSAGNQDHTDCVHNGLRSGRPRLRRDPGEAGR